MKHMLHETIVTYFSWCQRAVRVRLRRWFAGRCQASAATRVLDEMLPPHDTIATRLPSSSVRRSHAAANAIAADPSTNWCSESITIRSAALIASSLTSTQSSTSSRHRSKVTLPGSTLPAVPSDNVSSASIWMISPARTDAAIAASRTGEAPYTRIPGKCFLSTDATPLISPPPPTATTTASSREPASCSRISTPTVPWPAMTSGSLYGGTYTRSCSAAYARAFGSSTPESLPSARSSRPSRRSAATLLGDAFSGRYTMPCPPSVARAFPTPSPWLPVDAVTTPRDRSESVSVRIFAIAPRALNEPVRWSCSHYTSTSAPSSALNAPKPTKGVSGRCSRNLGATRSDRSATSAGLKVMQYSTDPCLDLAFGAFVDVGLELLQQAFVVSRLGP